ncbi:MAG: cadherin-like domain-containing protein [Armatimonadota bacterium]
MVFRKASFLILVLSVLFVVSSCGGGGGGTEVPPNGGNGGSGGNGGNGGEPANHPPEITAAEADPDAVWPGDETRLTCEGTDEDGDTLSFRWDASSGTLTEDGNTATWQAPDTTGQCEITCEVSDGRGGTAEATITVVVALGSVSGRAVDEDTGDGVAQLQVAFDEDFVATTGPDGNFLQEDLPEGEYTITVNAPDDYVVTEAPETVAVSEPDKTVSLPADIKLYNIASPSPPPPPPFDLD